MSMQPEEKIKIVYRPHPADIAMIAIAVAVIVLLTGHLDWLSAAWEQTTLAGRAGAAALIALFSALFLWGTRNEHRLDAEIDMALQSADNNLRRIDALQRRLTQEPRRKPSSGSAG